MKGWKKKTEKIIVSIFFVFSFFVMVLPNPIYEPRRSVESVLVVEFNVPRNS
mgnify:CR=1 FL=1